MDLEKIIFELKSIQSVFRLFSCLGMDAQVEDIAVISLEFEEKIQKIIKEIKQDMQK